MPCLSHSRAFFLLAALGLWALSGSRAVAQDVPAAPATKTSVHLRWGQRAGVSRYRLQVAHDADFTDIVFDRVVSRNEIEINELDPGKYFWRVASLTSQRGEFSSAGVLVVPGPSPAVTERRTNTESDRVPTNAPVAGGGWRAAIPNISSIVTGHLRLADGADLVVLNANGTVSAVDAGNGVAFWSARPAAANNRTSSQRASVLMVPSLARLENVVLLHGTAAIELEGATGGVLWRAVLPFAAAAGTSVSNGSEHRIIVIDESRRRAFIIADKDGQVLAQLTLPGRVLGAPVSINDKGAFALAYESGDVEVRDATGATLRSANVGSNATTAPLFVRGRTANLILLGTRAGLTAVEAGDLHALGRIAIPNDAPRGTLVAQDLDGDGVAEVLMATERGHLMAVNTTFGKIVWDVPAVEIGDSLSFADLNGDRVLDVFVSDDHKSAMALSGRDGAIIWKDSEASKSATNHVTASGSRDLVAVPFGASVLLIAVEPSGAGLRALSFSNAPVSSGPP